MMVSPAAAVGLQRERTSLARTRTALTVAVAGLCAATALAILFI
jgi:hypothetical protein